MIDLSTLPVRVFDDLRIEADPGARLTPDQGFAVAQRIIERGVHQNIAAREAQRAVRPKRAGVTPAKKKGKR